MLREISSIENAETRAERGQTFGFTWMRQHFCLSARGIRLDVGFVLEFLTVVLQA